MLTYCKAHNLDQLYHQYISILPNAPANCTFYRWNTMGCRFISLVAAGSMYLLVLIAGLDLKWKIANTGAQVVLEVCKMLRDPEASGEP
jgi:hypothetical protein